MTKKKDLAGQKDRKETKPTYGAATRDLILKAARVVFSRSPYNAASIRMIAAEGDFYHSLIRHHFPSKASIFEAVSKEGCQDLIEANRTWLKEVEGLAPEKGLSLYLDRFIAYYRNHSEIFRIIVQNLSQEDAQSIPGYDHLTQLLSGTRADAENTNALPFDKDSSVRFLESFNALLIHYLGSGPAEARLLGFEPDSPAYLKWVKDTVMVVFLPGLEKALDGHYSMKRTT